MNEFEKQIQALEIKLLHVDMQANPLLLDELLAETFEEIDSNGVVSSRQAVAEWLINKNKNDRWLLSDFRVSVLSHDIALAIYQAQKIGVDDCIAKISTRSSIWKRYGQIWKMVFHQASKPSI